MCRYEKLTNKAHSLIAAASKCKTEEGRDILSQFANTIIGVRDSMTIEEAMKND